ncbi:complement factor H-related protein 4-like [Hippoglossus stenolepis]|uniref:complement factor H-related protein 4-like n=1 Tax=Hippoglossus stenolepis TaxID=195615 RepID=UPI001FAEC273|nr:complement factor H-related protein 4-like [Hippoglossus stenolepis]
MFGKWTVSDHFPTCGAPLDCEQPPPLANGDTKNSMKFSYRQNERVEYICQNYYIMQEDPSKRATTVNGPERSDASDPALWTKKL